MKNSVSSAILNGEGVSIHVTLDDTNSFYCETRRLALQAIKALLTFGLNPAIRKETTIPSKANGPIKVFPVQIGNIQGNTLIIPVKNDLMRAIGLEGIFRQPQLHNRGVKVVIGNDVPEEEIMEQKNK